MCARCQTVGVHLKLLPPAEPTRIPLGFTRCSLAVVKHCLPHRAHIPSRALFRPTCQWLQLDQGTATARGHHVETAEGPFDTFLDVLPRWGHHWDCLGYQSKMT